MIGAGIRPIIGIVLIVAGLGVIGYALVASYPIFTGAASPPEIFKLSTEEVVSEDAGFDITSGDVQGEISDLISDQLKGILPAANITTILNLTAWSMFAGLLFFGGAQIAGIGIKLLRA